MVQFITIIIIVVLIVVVVTYCMLSVYAFSVKYRISKSITIWTKAVEDVV